MEISIAIMMRNSEPINLVLIKTYSGSNGEKRTWRILEKFNDAK